MLRPQVFDHVQKRPVVCSTRARTGALVTLLNRDVQGAQPAFTSTLSNVVGNIVGVTATLAAMFVLSWQITLLSLVLGAAAIAAGAGDAGMGIIMAGQHAAQGSDFAFTRSQESSAELAGASDLSKAGHRGRGSRDFFQKWENKE